VSVQKQQVRSNSTLQKSFISGILIQTSDGRKIGSFNGPNHTFRPNIPGRQIGAFHGTYSEDGLHKIGKLIFYCFVFLLQS